MTPYRCIATSLTLETVLHFSQQYESEPPYPLAPACLPVELGDWNKKYLPPVAIETTTFSLLYFESHPSEMGKPVPYTKVSKAGSLKSRDLTLCLRHKDKCHILSSVLQPSMRGAFSLNRRRKHSKYISFVSYGYGIPIIALALSHGPTGTAVDFLIRTRAQTARI
jgi:hypothetical protein